MEIIQIEISAPDNISLEEQQNFIDEFTNRLQRELIQNEINESIKRSLTSILYKKPTDMFQEKYKRITSNETDKTCSICFEQFKEGEYKRTLTCKHEYHKKCIDKWINKGNYSCPICRADPFSKFHQEIFFQNPPQ